MINTDIALTLIRDFELRAADRIVEMSPSSQRLVSFVALHDRPVRRSRVSGTLWQDVTDDRANARLRSALWRLPSAGGEAVLQASATHLWLNPLIEVDFRDTIARAQAVLSAGGDTAAIDIARELSSFGDDLLPSWCDDWVIMERERFHHLRLNALDELGAQLATAGRYADALQLGLAAVHAEPLRETAHRLLTDVHLRQGNVAAAIVQFRSYERMLAVELGARPSSAMRALMRHCIDDALVPS
jgi:DNA-binding SARP family transcriptional activator